MPLVLVVTFVFLCVSVCEREREREREDVFVFVFVFVLVWNSKWYKDSIQCGGGYKVRKSNVVLLLVQLLHIFFTAFSSLSLSLSLSLVL